MGEKKLNLKEENDLLKSKVISLEEELKKYKQKETLKKHFLINYNKTVFTEDFRKKTFSLSTVILALNKKEAINLFLTQDLGIPTKIQKLEVEEIKN